MSIVSEFMLDEVTLGAGTGPFAHIAIADVPLRLARPSIEGAFFQASRTSFLLNVPNVARFLVSDGCRIDVAPESKSTFFRQFLYGAPMAALLLQQTRLVLQASAVRTEHGALLLLGRPASGKSIVATALHSAGFPLISDDLCVVDPSAKSLLPGPRFHWLWQHDVERLDLTKKASRVRPDVDRYFVPLAPQATDPIPIFAICVLDAWNDAIARVVPLSGAAKSGGLIGNLYHRSVLETCYAPSEYLQRISALFGVPIYKLWCPRKSRSLAATIDELCNRLNL